VLPSLSVSSPPQCAWQNKTFWSTKDAGQQPFAYKAGVGGVIVGWDQGCLGMEIGEVRKLDIPYAEGYGAAGMLTMPVASARLGVSFV
jgi:FKBP-type peptidyl-prolyl cis-trans isomerase